MYVSAVDERGGEMPGKPGWSNLEGSRQIGPKVVDSAQTRTVIATRFLGDGGRIVTAAVRSEYETGRVSADG